MKSALLKRSDRLCFVDWIRAAGILYVVAYWHLFEWVREVFNYVNPLTTLLKYLALGSFVFVSGYLLAGRKTKITTHGLRLFYLKRLVRILPLYLLALVIFLWLGWTSWGVAIKSAVGLSLFWGPAPLTLWFVAMLLAYYVTAPFLAANAQSPARFVAASGAFFAAIVALKFSLPDGDSKVVIYFPAFCLGVWWGSAPRRTGKSMVALLLGISLLCFASLSLLEVRGLKSLLYILTIACGSCGLFAWCERRASSFPRSALVLSISYAS
jgi:peptidoglycan/LPS O-acetylase OafA/YrhL